MSDFSLDLDLRAVDELVDTPEVERLLQDVVDEVARRARASARRNTGAGAESIHGEVHRGAPSSAFAGTYEPEDNHPTGYVSWDQEHFYMGFSEEGTEHQAAQPAVRPALEQVRI
jgi:HK97 gp10 family phage protein